MKLDHLVYIVPDLDDAMSEFERRLGVAPRPGGRHPGLGTCNAILPLEGETYLELMAIDREGPTPANPRPFGLDELQHARLATWAVRSHDIDSDVARARERGFDPGIVIGMSRDAPGGASLRWHLSIRREAFGDGLVPFVIDWGETPHPSQGSDALAEPTRLTALRAGHPDPDPIHRALDAMDVALDVLVSESPWLEVTLEGPTGSWRLQ